MIKKGIIFDMDGTLWDSAAQVAASWNEAADAWGYERTPLTTEDIQGVMGKTMDAIAAALYPKVQGEESKALMDACCKRENDYLREHGGVLYPQIRETVEKLREKYAIYIVSNCQSGYIEAFLDYYQFHDLIDDFACYGDNGRPKADNIRIVCERNQLDKAVYVGDIQGDYDASIEAGAAFIHAAYGFGAVREPVLKIQSFQELTEVVPRVLD